MACRLHGDERGLSTFRQVVLLSVAVLIASGAFWVFYVQKPPTATPPRTAEMGDTVEIGYIGYFQDTGRVFDTSYESVARDNVSYLKAISFGWRGRWQNFSFEIGTGAAIRGFDEGVRGMGVGEFRRVVVPPEKGYGSLDPSLLVERQLLQEVPAREQMNETAFADRFGIVPQDGLVVIDLFWKWNVTVAVSNNIVTITHSPTIGQKVRPYNAWDAHVGSIDDSANNGSGIVYVRHELGPDDAGGILARDQGRDFIVMTVDLARGVYVANYNREVVGRTLVFDITMASITRI